MSNIKGELTYTLKQAFSGIDIGLNMQQAPSPFGLLHEFETSNFDYEGHLLNVLTHVDMLLSKGSDSSVKKQLENLNTGFGQILENYRVLKNKNS